MDILNFIDAAVAFLNIGIFSTLICRFTGANMAMLVFCTLTYMGSLPTETVGIMLTYLIFMRLTIYTQKQKLNFKKLQVFKGMRIFIPVLLIVVSLFIYPFAALAVFLFVFMLEILAKLRALVPEERRMPIGQIISYIVIGSVLVTLSMIATAFIPAAWYYMIGGIVGILICVFTWWLGQNRDRLSDAWDKLLMLSCIPLGLFGFEIFDWIDDMRRNINRTLIAYNLPFILMPILFVGFIMSNLLFGIFSLSGLLITFFGALGLRLFGYYEMSRKGKANLLSLGITVLAIFILFLSAPEPVGVSKELDAFLPANYFGFKGIMSLF